MKDNKKQNFYFQQSKWLTKIMKFIWKPWGDFFLFAIVGFIASIVTIITFLSPDQGQSIKTSSLLPKPMSGEFNIAVAHFGEGTKNGLEKSDISSQISDLLFNFLDSEYNSINFGLEVQVSHKNIPIIEEDIEAEKVARDINADIIIYGNVQIHGGNAEFFPRFYIANRPSTSELTGVSRLESPIQFRLSDLSFQSSLNKELRKRTNIILLFTKALVYFSANKLEDARKSFEEAITEAKGGKSFKGQEVLYLFLAVTNTLQKKYDDAFSNLAESLKINPEYARSYIAKGNIYYALSVDDWSRNQLDQAAGEYQKASTAKDQPVGAYIIEKVNVSLGNIFVVRAQQINNSAFYEEAINYYNNVINAYDITQNENIKKMAASAYFGLGAAYERQRLYTQAYDSYRHCIELSTEPGLISRSKIQMALITEQGLPFTFNMNFFVGALATIQAAFGHLLLLLVTYIVYCIRYISYIIYNYK